MKIGKVIGTVISTCKDPKLEGVKLLIVQPTDLDGKPDKDKYIIAVDTVRAALR